MEETAPPKHRPPLRGWHVAVATALLLAGTGVSLTTPAGADPMQNPALLGLSVALFAAWGLLAIRVMRSRTGWERRTWAWFALAGFVVIVALVAFLGIALAGITPSDNWTSPILLGVYGVALVGLLQLARRQVGPGQDLRLLLDAAIMAGAMFFVLWSAVYRDLPVQPTHPVLGRAALMATPALDAALATMALLAFATPAAGRPTGYLWFLTGIAMEPLVDALGTYATLSGSAAAAQASNVAGLGSSLLLLLGTLAIARGPPWTNQAPAAPPLWVEMLPITPMAFALLTAMEAWREHGGLTPLQFWVAAAVILLFLLRLALTLAQNHRLRRDLESTANSRTQLLRFVSHEMANPLSPLAIQAYIARNGDPAKRERAWQVIDRSLGRLTTLSRDVRDMALADSGRIVQAVQAAPLAPHVTAACRSAEAVAHQHGLTLDVDPGPAGLVVGIDPERFGQALDNLISNAIKYTPPGGHVQVTARPTGTHAEVAVHDTGVGLTQDQLGRLFGLFARPRTDAPGLGLGLYLSRLIAQGMGGSLTAASAGPGQGTTFTLAVPLAGDPRPHAAAA